MPANPKETTQHEPISLYLKEKQLSPAGEWADYLLHLNQEVFGRRDVPSVIDADDAFSLSWVPQDEMIKFLTKDGEAYDSEQPQLFWQTRLANLDKEIDRVGPENSKLGITLLTLKGYIETLLQDKTVTISPATTINAPLKVEITHMFGNGLKVIELNENTVKLSPVNPRNEELLADRATALTRLGKCYDSAGMIRVPKPISISSKQKYIEVQRAHGFSLATVNREQQTIIDELPPATRTRLITQFLRGIDILNLGGYIFGDYNESSFNFDPNENVLWITDPGLNEIRTGDFSKQLPFEKASSMEIFKMFEGRTFINLLDTLGLEISKLEKLKSMSSSKQITSIDQIIEIVNTK